MSTIIILLLLLLSYLLGSIPHGLIIGKVFKGIDIRTAGSKSTGATNTMRLLGLPFGILTLILDALKGAIIIGILRIFDLKDLYLLTIFEKQINILGLYGIAAVIGHVFSIYIGFKGGKAVATSYGVLMSLTPVIGIVATLLFVLVVAITKYVSLASILVSILVLVTSIVGQFIVTEKNIPVISIEQLITYLILVIIIYLRHNANIKRLQSGTENKIDFKKKNS